jgi:hypothetical protein
MALAASGGAEFDVADLVEAKADGGCATKRIGVVRFHLSYDYHHADGPEGFYKFIDRAVQANSGRIVEISITERAGECRIFERATDHTYVAVRVRSPEGGRFRIYVNVLGEPQRSQPKAGLIADQSQFDLICTVVHQRGPEVAWRMREGGRFERIQQGPAAPTRAEMARKAYDEFAKTNGPLLIEILRGRSKPTLTWLGHVDDAGLIGDHMRLEGMAIVFDSFWDEARVSKAMHECLNADNGRGRRPDMVVFVLGNQRRPDHAEFDRLCEDIVAGNLVYRRASIQDAPLSTWRPSVFVFAGFPLSAELTHSSWSLTLPDCSTGGGHLFTPEASVARAREAVSRIPLTRPNPRVLAIDELYQGLFHYQGHMKSLAGRTIPQQALHLFHAHFTLPMLRLYLSRGFSPVIYFVDIKSCGLDACNYNDRLDELVGLNGDFDEVDPYNIGASVGRKVMIGNVVIRSVPLTDRNRAAMERLIEKNAADPERLPIDDMGLSASPSISNLLTEGPSQRLLPFPPSRVRDGAWEVGAAGGRRGAAVVVGEFFKKEFGLSSCPIRTESPDGIIETIGFIGGYDKTVLTVDWGLPTAVDVYVALVWLEEDYAVVRVRADDVAEARFSLMDARATVMVVSGEVSYLEADPSTNSWSKFKEEIAPYLRKIKAGEKVSAQWWAERCAKAPVAPVASAPETSRPEAAAAAARRRSEAELKLDAHLRRSKFEVRANCKIPGTAGLVAQWLVRDPVPRGRTMVVWLDWRAPDSAATDAAKAVLTMGTGMMRLRGSEVAGDLFDWRTAVVAPFLADDWSGCYYVEASPTESSWAGLRAALKSAGLPRPAERW